jgi:hypothetical protein
VGVGEEHDLPCATCAAQIDGVTDEFSSYALAPAGGFHEEAFKLHVGGIVSVQGDEAHNHAVRFSDEHKTLLDLFWRDLADVGIRKQECAVSGVCEG